MSTCEQRCGKRQEQRRQREHAHLLDYFQRVTRVMDGDAPPSYQAGGWPFWVYHATPVKELDWQVACAFGGDELEDYGDFALEGYPNTVQFPATCSMLTGRPNMHDHNDVTGSTYGSIGRAHHVSLERLGDALAAHEDAVETVESDGVLELDAPPSTLPADDDALANTQTRLSTFASPAYAQAVRSPYPARLVEVLAIGKTRDRHVALGRILRDIRAHTTTTFYIRTRLYLTGEDAGFGAYLRQRSFGIRHRGRNSRRAGK